MCVWSGRRSSLDPLGLGGWRCSGMVRDGGGWEVMLAWGRRRGRRGSGRRGVYSVGTSTRFSWFCRSSHTRSTSDRLMDHAGRLQLVPSRQISSAFAPIPWSELLHLPGCLPAPHPPSHLSRSHPILHHALTVSAISPGSSSTSVRSSLPPCSSSSATVSPISARENHLRSHLIRRISSAQPL